MQTFPADLPCFHRLLTQYVIGGDFSGQTDNLIYDPGLPLLTRTATHSGLADDTLTAATELRAGETAGGR